MNQTSVMIWIFLQKLQEPTCVGWAMHRSFQSFTDLRRRFTWVRRPFRTLRPCPRHRTDPLLWLVGSSRITEPFRFHSIRLWWPPDPRVPLDAVCLAECAEAFLYLLHRSEVRSGPLRWWNSTLRIDPRHLRIESAAAEFFFKQKVIKNLVATTVFRLPIFIKKNIQLSFFLFRLVVPHVLFNLCTFFFLLSLVCGTKSLLWYSYCRHRAWNRLPTKENGKKTNRKTLNDIQSVPSDDMALDHFEKKF